MRVFEALPRFRPNGIPLEHWVCHREKACTASASILESTALLAEALSLGTTKFLRGADALYCATTALTGCDLVSWDKEHLKRAGALTPDDWLIANP